MSKSHFHQRLSEILDNVPASWFGTTYPNDKRYVGRQRFLDEMLMLLFGNQPIQKAHLDTLFSDDYCRVGSPLSSLFELVRAVDKGYQPANVFSFASSTLPLIAVLLTSQTHTYVYDSNVYGKRIFTDEQEEMLRKSYGCNFTFCSGAPQAHGIGVVVQLTDAPKDQVNDSVHAVVDSQGLLYVTNPDIIPPEDIKDNKGKMLREGIHTMRKRLGAPPPTPDLVSLLRGEPLHQSPDITAVNQHLKELAGLGDAPGEVLIATVGLSALGACVMGALEMGGRDIDVLMCSTAYGGSSQQTDILSKTCGITKHTFDIQGKLNVFQALTGKLQAMKANPKALTFIQLEYPTNPDMKDCDLKKLQAILQAHGSKVVIMLDTTFSPISRSATYFSPDVPVIVFNSLSKSVSGGFTTGGSLVANNNELAQSVLQHAHKHLELMGTISKGSQLQILHDRHMEVEDRVAEAHANAKVAAAHLEDVVRRHSGTAMKVNFVTQVQMDKEVTPATFSFNLPAPAHLKTKPQILQALAQKFVDELVANNTEGIKPCVSFGQKNTLVYATVPATSTQGVISDEAKSKQAIGGVQLVRFSFPPIMNMYAWKHAVEATVGPIYSPKASL